MSICGQINDIIFLNLVILALIENFHIINLYGSSSRRIVTCNSMYTRKLFASIVHIYFRSFSLISLSRVEATNKLPVNKHRSSRAFNEMTSQ